MKQKLAKLLRKLRGYLPERVPQGMSELNQLVASIIELYNPPCNERTVKFVISTLLMRLNPTEDRVSKIFYVKSLRRGAAAQVGAYAMEEIKDQQRAEEQAAKIAEAAASQADNVQQISDQTI